MRGEPDPPPLDVLVVGAGPTGLALATQLRAFGARFRLVDRLPDRVHESRALAIQPRTLEVLAPFGVTGDLVAHGNPAVRLHLHAGGRAVEVPLFDIGLADTAYPFLLFLSQAQTERFLGEHLDRVGVAIERSVELVDLRTGPTEVTCRLRHPDGRQETVRARYVVGCDGAHSTVREQAGIPFAGAAYPQTFLLADLEVDGLEPGAAHTWLTDAGILFFFPLGEPATWRVLAMRSPTHAGEVTLDEVQALVDAATAERLRLHDPVWMTDFRIHLRGADRYRSGRVFLAGDAAHIHSPAGAQGMNTGIQDATNLGWKLALVARHAADPALLETYESERAPVGRVVLRLTNRMFTVATTTNPLVRLARTRIVPRLAPLALRFATGRAAVFRTLSELNIHYRRSPASTTGAHPPRRGPKPGDRLPDGEIVHDGQQGRLHGVLAAPAYHLVLCGPAAAWPAEPAGEVVRRWAGLVAVHRLGVDLAAPDLRDPSGTVLRRLGLGPADAAQYLVRPDGHVAYRAGGTDPAGVCAYLARWLVVADGAAHP